MLLLFGMDQLTPDYVCHQLSFYLGSVQLNRGVGANSRCSSHQAVGGLGLLTRLRLRTWVVLRPLLALDY